jgi:CheY-like chemotaxis protein
MAPALTRILIVEDNQIIAAMMEAMVEDLGYWVVGPSRNLDDGLEHAKDDEVDFALLDYELGEGKTARPIVEVLRRREIPFAFTTGSDPREIRAAFGDVPVISKPVLDAELEAVLP